MIQINKIPVGHEFSIYRPPLIKALKAIYDEIVQEFGVGSPEEIEAKRKYIIDLQTELQIEKPISIPEGLSVCFANIGAGYARTDTIIEQDLYQNLDPTITVVQNYAELEQALVGVTETEKHFYLVEEAMVVYAILNTAFNRDLIFSIVHQLRVDGATIKTSTGEVRLNGNYNLELRDRILINGKVDVKIMLHDGAAIIGNDVRPDVPEYQVVDSYVKNRNPYWVGMKATLDQRLKDLTANDPNLELTISKERYEPLTSTDPDHLLSAGGIDVMVVRKTGFMRVGIDVANKTFDEILDGLKVPVTDVTSILPIKQHIGIGYTTTLYREAPGVYGMKLQGQDPVKEMVGLLGNISFADISYEDFPSPGFNEEYQTGVLYVSDPAFGTDKITIPVYNMQVVGDIILDKEIVVFPETNVRVLKEGKDQNLFNFTITNYDPVRDGLLRSETTVILGDEQVEEIKDLYVIESTINHVVTVDTKLAFNVDIKAGITLRTKLFLVKDGVSTLLSTVLLPRVYGVVDRSRFAINRLDHVGGTTDCYFGMSDYEDVAQLTQENYESLKISEAAGLTVTIGAQVTYDVDLDSGMFTGFHAAYNGSSITVANLYRRMSQSKPLRMGYKTEDFDFKQTSAVMKNRRLRAEFMIEPKQFPISSEIRKLDTVNTDKWCTFTPGVLADVVIDNNKVAFTLDFVPDAWIQDDILVTFRPTVLMRTPVQPSDGIPVTGAGQFLLAKSNYDLVFSEIRHNYDHTSGLAELLFKVRNRTDKIVKGLYNENVVYTADEEGTDPTIQQYDDVTGVMRLVFRPTVAQMTDTKIKVTMDVVDGGQYFGAFSYETTIATLVALEIEELAPFVDGNVTPATITWRYRTKDPHYGSWSTVSMEMPALSAANTLDGILVATSQSYDPVTKTGEIVYEVNHDTMVDMTYRLNGKMIGVNNGVEFNKSLELEYVLPSAGGFRIHPGVMKVDGRAVTQAIQITNDQGVEATRAEILTFDSVKGIEGNKNTPDTEEFKQVEQLYTFTATTVERPTAPLEIGFQGDMFVNDIPLPFNLKKIIPYITIKQNSEKMVGDRAVATAILHDTEDNTVRSDVAFNLLSMTNQAPNPDFQFVRVAPGSTEWELSAAATISNEQALTYQFSIEATTEVDGMDITIPGALTVVGTYETPDGGITVSEKNFVLTDTTATVTLVAAFNDGKFPMGAKLNTNFSIHSGTKPGVTEPASWSYDPSNGELVFVWEIVKKAGTRYEFASTVEFPLYPEQVPVSFEVEKSSEPLPVPLSVTRFSEDLTGDLLTIVNVIKQSDGVFPSDLVIEVPFDSVEGTLGDVNTPESANYDPLTGKLTYSFRMVTPIIQTAKLGYYVSVASLEAHRQHVMDVPSTVIIVPKVYTFRTVEQYLKDGRFYSVQDVLVNGEDADIIGTHELIASTNLDDTPDWTYTAWGTQPNRVRFSGKVKLPSDENQKLTYSMTIKGTFPEDKTAEQTATMVSEDWEVPVGPGGETEPTITLRKFTVANGKSTVEFDLGMADGSFPVGAKFRLPLDVADYVVGELDPESFTYNPATGVAKFILDVEMNDVNPYTYHFAGLIELWPYKGELTLPFDISNKFGEDLSPVAVTEATLSANGAVGTISMTVKHADGSIPAAVVLISPVDEADHTLAGTKELTNVQYDDITGRITANIALEQADPLGTEYRVKGRVYSERVPGDIQSYEVRTTVASSYHIDWDEPILGTRVITHSGKVVPEGNSGRPGSVVVEPIVGGIGLEGVNPTSQSYDPETMILTYTVGAKEVTTVPVIFDYEGMVTIDGAKHGFRVTETIKPMTINASPATYYDKLLTVEYTFSEGGTYSDREISAELLDFKISNGGSHAGYVPPFTWARKGEAVGVRHIWVATYVVPDHETKTNRWDWTLEFTYPFDAMNVTVKSTGYKQLALLNQGTLKFRPNPAYEQKGSPVGTYPVMEVTWTADALDSDGAKPSSLVVVSDIVGSGVADNGKVWVQSYDPVTGVLTMMVKYYGSADDVKNISVSSVNAEMKVLAGFAKPAVTGQSFILPKPVPFAITDVKDELSGDRTQLKTTFKVVPENGVYPFDFSMKMPFTSTQKTLAGTRYPIKLSEVGEPDRYYDYDRDTGIGSFTFMMAAVVDFETVNFVTDLYSKAGGIKKDVIFPVTINSAGMWQPTHQKTLITDKDVEVTYVLQRAGNVFPNAVTVKGFDAPVGITGPATNVQYDPATGTIKFHVVMNNAAGVALNKITINPIFTADSQDVKPKLTHDVYGYAVVQTTAGHTESTNSFRIINTVKRRSDNLDAPAGKYTLTSSTPAANGPVNTVKIGSAPAVTWEINYTVPPLATDDKTVFTAAGFFTVELAGNLFQAVPFTGQHTQFLTGPSYVNAWLKAMTLKGDELTVEVNNQWGQAPGYPQGTAYTNKPFEATRPTLNDTLTPISESYDQVTGILKFVFKMSAAFAQNGGEAYFRTRVNFPAYGDNVTKPALDTKVEVTQNVPAPIQVNYISSLESAVFTGNKLVETFKFATADNKYPNALVSNTLNSVVGAVEDPANPPVYDKTTGLLQVTYVCDQPTDASPIAITSTRVIDPGSDNGVLFTADAAYTHYTYKVTSVNATQTAGLLVLDHEVTQNGSAALNLLSLTGCTYTNSVGTPSLLAHTAGDKIWKLNLPINDASRPFHTTGSGNYRADLGNKVFVNLPFNIVYDEPLTPATSSTKALLNTGLFSQVLSVRVSGSIPATAKIKTFTPVTAFLPNVSNSLSQSYNSTTGELHWSAKVTPITGNFAAVLEADMVLEFPGGLTQNYKVKFAQNSFDMRPYDPAWVNGKLERLYYVTQNGGSNFQRTGQFIANNFAPADPGQTLATIHAQSEVGWTIRFPAAAPSANVPTQYTGAGVLELYEADGLTVHLPWTLDFTHQPPKAPYVASHLGSQIKDGVLTVRQLINNSQGDLPATVTLGDLTGMTGTVGGTLTPTSKNYDPATGIFTYTIPVDPIPANSSKVYRTAGTFKADTDKDVAFSVQTTGNAHTVEPVNIRTEGPAVKVDYNLIRTSDQTSVNNAKHHLTSLTHILPGEQSWAVEHYTGDVPYKATYAMERFTGASKLECSGYISVLNAEKLELWVPFSWTYDVTGPIGTTGQAITLRDVTWTDTEVTFWIHTQYNLEVHWATGSVDSPVTRVYTPSRQDGAAVKRQSYDADTGIIQVVFNGGKPTAVPQDYQLTCYVNANGGKTPNTMTFTRLLTSDSPNGIFGLA